MPQAKQTDDEIFRVLNEILTPEDDIRLQKAILHQKNRKGAGLEAVAELMEDETIFEQVWEREARFAAKWERKNLPK
jgi:hypothetical protein